MNKKILVAILLCFFMSVTILPNLPGIPSSIKEHLSIPNVFATSVVQTNKTVSSSATETVKFPSSVTAGNALVVFTSTNNIASGPLNPTDTIANSFTKITFYANQTCGAFTCSAYVYCAISGGSGADTVSWTNNDAAGSNAISIAEVSGISCTGSMHQTGTGTGTAISVTSYTPMANSFVAATSTTSVSPTWTPGAGYTQLVGVTGTSQPGSMYQVIASGSTTSPETISSSGQWIELSASFPPATITETITGKLPSGGQTEKATLSGAAGCTPTNMNFSTAGSTNTLTCNPSSALTVTVAAGNATARWWGNSTWTSHTSFTFTTGVSSESHTLYNYFQLNKSYTATPTSPATWDANYNIKVNATFLGISSTTIATLSAVSASGITAAKANFSDYNSAQILPASFLSSVTGKWLNASASQFKDTVASAVTHNVNYQRDYLNNFLYTLLYGGAIGTVTMTCPVSSLSTNYVLTTVAQSLACDPGSTASVTGTVTPGSGERIIANISSFTVSGSSGGSTYNFVYVHQYELNMSISGPGVTSPVGSNFYNSGNVVAITAFPNAGAAFSSWTGSGTGSFTGTTASATVTISASISELATFNSVGSVSVSLTLNLINAGKIVNSTNYFSISYFAGGVSTNIHFVGTNPLTFTADGGKMFNITSPSQLSGSKNRWCLSSGCAKFTTPNSPLSGSWILAYSYFEQDNISAFFTAPVSCGGCSGEVPSLSYVQFGSHLTGTLATSAATFWVDNGTSWTTTIPFFYDLSYWIPSPASGTFQKAQVLDITYTQTPSSNLAANCGSATDPFIQFVHMCWIPGFIDSYGNLIGTGNFITILWCVFAVAVWLKSGNPLLTTIILLLGFATFSAATAGIAGTGLSFITSIGWQIGLIALVLVSTGTVVRLFVGRNS